jgi:pyrroline-5-carboxylate reductase
MRLAFIGAGQMAEALVGGLLAARRLDASSIRATDPSADRRDLLKRRFGIRVGEDNREACAWATTVLVAVKPQVLDEAVAGLAPAVRDQLIVSIAAGASIRRLAARLPEGSRVVRVMPNAPALVREGMSALAFGPGVTDADGETARSIFEAVGRVMVVEERWMDAVTGLSGSGPAYVFLAVEALADGGVKMGLPRPVAELLAAQTMLGAARMVLDTAESPGRLKDRVASPGGTTIAGLHRLEQGGLRASLIDAVEAATLRARELGD